jgi:ketosteroid isomerase-like protein|tara:strand:- start:61 stop:450 length:390 start_codon:yes stop_codon:yes gene_type:complete
MTTDLLAATTEFVDAFTNQDLEKIMGFFHADGVFCALDGTRSEGEENIKSAMEDILPIVERFEEHDSFIDAGQGDSGQAKVVSEWTLYLNIKGKKYAWDGLDIIHWQDGKIVLKSTYAKTEKPRTIASP